MKRDHPAYNTAYHDSGGRLHATRSTEIVGRFVEARGFFDACATDSVHLTRALDVDEPDRRACRADVADMIPETARGKRGRWRVTITFVEE